MEKEFTLPLIQCGCALLETIYSDVTDTSYQNGVACVFSVPFMTTLDIIQFAMSSRQSLRTANRLRGVQLETSGSSSGCSNSFLTQDESI